MLILLSDIDGVFDKDPKTNPDAKLISAADPTKELSYDKSAKPSTLGTGGIVTKISACTEAALNGIDAVVANATNVNVIYDILEGKNVGTFFKGIKK